MNIKIKICSSSQQLGRAHAQCVGNFLNAVERDVTHLLRYVRNVRFLRAASAMRVNFKYQRFLRLINDAAWWMAA